jgi:hypothetical protein
MDWDAEIESLERGRIRRIRVRRDGTPVAHGDAVAAWRDDAGFRGRFIGWLAEAPFEAYFWETPAVTEDTISRAFEFVFVDAPSLAAMPPDVAAFREHFRDTVAVSAFHNLGGDALMVAPNLGAAGHAYPHLAAFARAARVDVQHELWRTVGSYASARIGARPLWVSTSGLGVAWLHVRLDSDPKYYTFEPYRSAG